MATKQLLLRLPENTYKELKIRAIQEGKRVSQLALEWFKEKLGTPVQSVDGVPIRTFSDDELNTWESMDKVTPATEATLARIHKAHSKK
ncbi:MAG: hypothetical protein HQM09_20795 [Candidatus Riflebacteria bacterium]|nr:hypothetical protein [Candidatus Riflebacteria bacterium]